MISFEEFCDNYTVVKLQSNDKIVSFDCGDDDLNDFILNEALMYKQQRLAESYILFDKNNSSNIVAYFTLSNDKIAITDFTTNNQFNRFKKKKFPKEKFLRSYPSVKIGRLAVNKNSCGLGIGTHLLRFIKMFFLAENKTGCRFITVDAYNAAVLFYERNGFSFLQEKDEQPTQLMYFDLMTVNVLQENS